MSILQFVMLCSFNILCGRLGWGCSSFEGKWERSRSGGGGGGMKNGKREQTVVDILYMRKEKKTNTQNHIVTALSK